MNVLKRRHGVIGGLRNCMVGLPLNRKDELDWYLEKVIGLQLDDKLKLNPLRAKWPMELPLISGFCSVKRI